MKARIFVLFSAVLAISNCSKYLPMSKYGDFAEVLGYRHYNKHVLHKHSLMQT